MKRFPLAALFLLTASPLLAGERLTQFATIDSLLAGVYEGPFTCGDVLAAGDFGLGTFEAVDGEMIVADGIVYRARADGTLTEVAPEVTTPFAAVVTFDPEEHFPMAQVEGMESLAEQLEELLPNPNLPYAVRLAGDFSRVHIRAPHRQEPPYRPLVEVVAEQAEFERTEIAGEMIGFYLPPYVKGINVPGLHLHFLNAERDFGGHVLDFLLPDGSLEIDAARELTLRLPGESEAFKTADLGADRSAELEAVESDRR